MKLMTIALLIALTAGCSLNKPLTHPHNRSMAQTHPCDPRGNDSYCDSVRNVVADRRY